MRKPFWIHQRVWITGASSGIGAALAAALAREGARLLLSGRDPGRLDAVRETCLAAASAMAAGAKRGPEAMGGADAPPVQTLAFDLASIDAAAAAPAEAEALMGGIDWLINNAGMGQRGGALETANDITARLMTVNFLSPVALTRGVLPGMLARGKGRVAAVTSLLAKFGAPQRSAYAASKHALHGWFDSLRAELAGTGVGVTLLAPGWVNTRISQNALQADGGRHGEMDIGQSRGLAPDVCAARMLRALRKGKDEQLVGGYECGAVYIKRFFPGLLPKLLARTGIG